MALADCGFLGRGKDFDGLVNEALPVYGELSPSSFVRLGEVVYRVLYHPGGSLVVTAQRAQ
jgi:hypothetical protein